MKYFVNCGAWNGYSVEVFRRVYDPSCEYEIHSFEVNPLHLSTFPAFENHILYSKAVWIRDEKADFYLDYSKKRAGSTLIKEKTSGKLDKNNPIKVECIDIDRWIKEKFKKDDFIVLKLDIEGAEYEVLPHMIEKGSIDYISNIFIEWHRHKCGIPKDVHDKLVKQIKIPIDDKWKRGNSLK